MTQLAAWDETSVSIIKSSNVLKERHLDLIVDRVHVCERAGIDLEHLTGGMKKFCKKEDRDFVKNFHHYKNGSLSDSPKGYLVHTSAQGEAIQRCKGMAGAFVRNYVNVRVIDVESIVDSSFLDVRVVLIPNFSPGGDSLLKWKQDMIQKNLYSRVMRNLLTVLFVKDSDTFMQQMGKSVYALTQAFYVTD